jgi:hypothetical protein
VEPVSFRDLIALLPEVDGWERSEPTGERMTSPFRSPPRKPELHARRRHVDVTITDSAFNQLLLAPMRCSWRQATSANHAGLREVHDQVNGHPGWEKWTASVRTAR